MNGLTIGALADQHIEELRRDALRRRQARKAISANRRRMGRRTR